MLFVICNQRKIKLLVSCLFGIPMFYHVLHMRWIDVLTLSNSEIQKLNQFHKTILKQVMHLHERTADTAVYILSGQLPLVADLHKGVLGTLGKDAS